MLAGKEVAMLCQMVHVAALLAVSASLLGGQAGAYQSPGTPAASLPGTSAVLNAASLAMEQNRAIVILRRGLKENWATRDQYLHAFRKTPATDPSGQPVADAKNYVECALAAHLRIHQIWDEGPPVGVEVERAIADLTKLRDEAAQTRTAEPIANPNGLVRPFYPPFCAIQMQQELGAPHRLNISAGVAAGMLRTRVVPVLPSVVLENHVSGTVVLRATISPNGRVEALRVVSGPALLLDATRDAVQQWIYRPYLLNGAPVEVETTITVVFPPSR